MVGITSVDQNLVIDKDGDNGLFEARTGDRVLSVGQKLMQARADRGGLDLEQISAELCIRPHLLAALEQDDFNKFPSACYAAGFLKNYATYLGLDIGRIVAQYKQEFNGSTKKVDLVFPVAESGRDYSQQIVVSLVILSALVLYGLWYFTGGQKNMTLAALPDMAEVASDILVSATEDDRVTAAATMANVTEQVSEPAVAERSEVSPERFTEAFAEGHGFQLVQQANAATVEASSKTTAVVAEQVRLIAAQDSWVRIIDADRRILVDRILLAGEEFYASGQPGMRLMTSNAGALSIYVGATVVAPFGEIGEIRDNISLDRQDLLVRTAQLSR